jgi:integrase
MLWQTRFKDQRAGLAQRRIRLRDGVERADADRDGTALLFPSRRGGYLSEGEVGWVFDPAAEAIGRDGLTPHGLRHTCASLTIAAGANVKVLQTQLGHKTATLTRDRYGHLFPDIWDESRMRSTTPLELLRTLCGRRPLSRLFRLTEIVSDLGF